MHDKPDPEALLALARREERERLHNGRLRIYLGAFAGVGKTFAMLSEAQRRKTYGEDVVVGFVETHGRSSTAQMLQGLEVIPRRRFVYGDVTIEEMDTDAILERHPAVCLVDELAHTNAPGSQREKRYEDVELLLSAGIDVVSTLNVQHLESLNDVVESITGVRVRETIPDQVLDDADEVILIDMSPQGARARMEHGHIYPPQQARVALENFFRAENLAALRELALKRAAAEADEQLEEYMLEAGHRVGVDEHVLVYIDESVISRMLIRRAWRLALGLRADLHVAYIRRERDEAGNTQLAKTLELAEDLNARIWPLEGEPANALTELLKSQGFNHIVLPQAREHGLRSLLRRSLADELMRKAPGVELHLLPANTP